jgi:uncharacterized protein (TIGR02687 family)
MNHSELQTTLFPKEENQQIKNALLRKFENHRIVFWYDAEKQLRGDYDLLDLDGIEKVELENNTLGLKYRMLREEPNQKFLLYKEGGAPKDIDNWLLDVELSHGVFRTDQAGLWLAELELPYEYVELAKQHSHFFGSQRRIQKLKEILEPQDSKDKVRFKMLAVSANANPRVDSILENLLKDYAAETTTTYSLIERSNLSVFLWNQVKSYYGYRSDNAGVKDFIIELFESCFAMRLNKTATLNDEALLFFERWKDSSQHRETFAKLSEECADILSLKEDLVQRDYRDLLEIDYFELIDQKILSNLVKDVQGRTISIGECTNYIRERRRSRWYDDFKNEYETIYFGAQLLNAIDTIILDIESLTQGVNAYCNSLFRVDQLYRKFLYHFRESRQTTLLNDLAEDVRNHYTNTFLRKLGDAWQAKVDELTNWSIPNVLAQRQFFDKEVFGNYLKNSNKIIVVISDALRYEAGEELARLIRQEDRFEATLTAGITGLPSYTQLGMASLLPNKSIQLENDAMVSVSVDGQLSTGLINRGKILNTAPVDNTQVIKSEELLNLTGADCRQLIREHDIVYVYHNQIDKIGHSRDSEQQAFSAVEDALKELVTIVKKLTSGNASNIIVTADHGFIYQDEIVNETDYSMATPGGDVIGTDRRFIIGTNLEEVAGVKKFTASELGLEGELEVIIPKSINRFRKSGSSTRFIHGGSTLQEIVIPIIHVKKRRSSDVSFVDVTILAGSNTVITSGQLAVVLYQTEPVTEKKQLRRLRIGIYSSSGQLISNTDELTFDLTSENARDRELKTRILLSKEADKFNDQEVLLKLEEPVTGTTHYHVYASQSLRLSRSFTGDFDF